MFSPPYSWRKGAWPAPGSPRKRAHHHSRFPLLALLLEHLAEEVVEKGADHRDPRQTDQRLLARRYDSGQDVGRELQRLRQNEPAADTEANAGKAGLVIPPSGRQPEGVAKADDHPGHRDEFEGTLNLLHAAQHALLPLGYNRSVTWHPPDRKEFHVIGLFVHKVSCPFFLDNILRLSRPFMGLTQPSDLLYDGARVMMLVVTSRGFLDMSQDADAVIVF